MHAETRYFLIFQNILRTKNFRNRMNFFSNSGVVFYERSGTFNEAILTLSLLACNIFSKNSWFLFLDKSYGQRSFDVTTCFFCTFKKQKCRSIQDHSWNPLHLQCYLSLSVWCVFCSFTRFLAVLFVLHRKNLVLLYLMKRLNDFYN